MTMLPRRRLGIAIVLAAVLLAGLALAQTVEDLDFSRLAKPSGEAARDAEALAREVERRSGAMRQEALAAAAAGRASLDRHRGSLASASAEPVDFEAIVSAAGENGRSGTGAPQLIVFASLSMPPKSLKPLIRDAARAGGSVVFNGFPGNSMKAFQQGIGAVVEDQAHYASIGIDPRLFRAFEVRAVPTFVVVTSDFAPCEGLRCETRVPPFDRMSGNVTLSHVLATFAQGQGPGAAIAEQALARLARPRQ